jgi:hypothetical protein
MITSISAIARHAALTLLPAALLAGGCRSRPSSSPIPVVDLIKEYEHADRRPAGGYAIGDHVVAGAAIPAILGPAPGRLTWVMPLPRHGMFRARIAASAAPVRIRVGISDARIYEQLTEIDVAPDKAWSDVSVDLSAYAGWKFSLFYRPERRAWRLNLSADAVTGIPAKVAWGRPEIVAFSNADAAEYAKRRLQITRSEAP